MKLDKKTCKLLKKNLPKGFGPVLQERLQNAGHRFSVAYIYRVINPNESDDNDIIVDEAILYLEEIKNIQFERKKRILELID